MEISNIENLHLSETLYKCSEKNEDFTPGKSEISFIQGGILKIRNSSNDGYESSMIEIVINKKLEVITLNYNHDDDTEDGSKDLYYAEKLHLILNKNPFIEGIEDLEGKFSFDVKVTHKPAEFYKFSKTFEKKINGGFECR